MYALLRTVHKPVVRILSGMLILVGLFVRLVQYFSERPLWVDEAMLTVNILHRSYRELLMPLDYEQQAPIGFLLVVKWLTTIFGIEETILRLLPLIASIASLFLMWMVASLILPSEYALLALLLFVFGAPLIYYASEVKPYAMDLTVGLLLTLIAVRMFEVQVAKRHRWLMKLFFVGFVGLWFSQAATFILAAIGITGMVESVVKRNRKWLLLWIGISAGWLVSFALQSAITLGEYYARYRGVWRQNYAPFPPASFDDMSWYWQTLMEVMRRPGGISLWPIGLVLFAAGAWYFFRKLPKLFVLLLLPGFLALSASALNYYPFTGRFLLFFTPAILLCISAGFWRMFLWARASPWLSVRILSIVLAVALIWNTVSIGIYRLQHPERFEVITPLIRYYLDNRQPGDTLYLYYGAAFAFDYYAKRFGIEPTYIKGIERTNELRQYQQDLQKLDGKRRVWVLFSHIYTWGGIDEEAYFLRQLDRMGTRTDGMHTEGASLYLYDLR